jgi:hypothetical protein
MRRDVVTSVGRHTLVAYAKEDSSTTDIRNNMLLPDDTQPQALYIVYGLGMHFSKQDGP